MALQDHHGRCSLMCVSPAESQISDGSTGSAQEQLMSLPEGLTYKTHPSCVRPGLNTRVQH